MSATGMSGGMGTLMQRVLLRAYPRWFRDEYGADLARHMARQREEPRYRARGLGVVRFWWDAGSDALRTGTALRVERGLETWARAWRGSEGSAGRGVVGGTGPNRGGVGTMLDAIMRDVRHALRGLVKNPGYAVVFTVTLGLGIGANTAMFSAVNGVLLRPLPHDDGDRLVYLRHSAQLAGIDNALFSVPEIDDYRQTVPSLEAVAEFSALTFTVLGLEAPSRVRAGIVTGNYFDVVGLSATLGRAIGTQDDGAAAPAVIALTDAYWRSFFGSDPDVVGRTLEINGSSATIVGIVEPAPPYPERTDIYVNMAASPHHLEATMRTDRRHRMTEIFAKLASGATVESARAEVASITSRIHAEYPEAYDAGSGYDVSVTPLKTQLTARARSTFLLLLGTAFFVLVIACANLANLTLTRVLRRDHELAIRVSLGGSRAALRRELLAESLLLAAGGAALGLMMASVSLDMIVAFAERFTSRASEIALDGSVFGFALLAAVAASFVFTLLPPLPDSDSVSGALTRSGTRSTVGAGGRRAQRALVVAQIGTSFVLLIGAGLLLRTMVHLNRIDPGFDTAEILSLDIPVDFETRAASPGAIRERYLSILDSVRALPGVASAALSSEVPLAAAGVFSLRVPVQVENHEPATGAATPRADLIAVSPGYFETMGIELIRGRGFTTTDTEDARKVVVINQTMARAYFGDDDPIGKRIAWVDPLLEQYLGVRPEMRTVVGVAADTRWRGIGADVAHTGYNPYPQIDLTGSLLVRAVGDPDALVPEVRGVVLAHERNQPITNVTTLEALGADALAPQRLNTILLGGFALLALVIAAVGIGGVLAFSVGSRRRDFGIMTALGASRHQVWSGVLAEGATLAGLGIALGTAAALGLARFISGLLIGVPALDPVTFAGVGILLAGVAIAAAWLPAWRAAEVNPLEALSSE